LSAPIPRFALLGFAFLLSGAAALVYQVAWQRLLALHSGVGVYSVAVIVAAFMAGLGAGSHLGGRLSLRTSPRAALVAFAALELAIGAFGAASCALYYDWLYPLGAGLYRSLPRAVLLHLLALLPPTLLMGMSLPLLARAAVRDAAGASRVIGTLYGVNVLGAAAGALLTPWVLLRIGGLRQAVLWAAAANVVAAAAALLALRAAARAADTAGTVAPDPPGTEEPPRPFRLWLALHALSGFCALSLELLWFRVMDVAAKSTSFTFGTLLALYLACYGAGTLWAAARWSRPARPLGAFLFLQCVLVAYAGLAILALGLLPPDAAGYRWLVEYWRAGEVFQFGHGRGLQTAFRLYLAFPLALFGPPTFLMGVAFPVLQRAVQDDPRTSGFKVGLLQAANIAGCAAGSLVVGIGVLDALGTLAAVRALLLLALVFAVLGLALTPRRGRFAGAAAALALTAAALPGGETFWARLHGAAGAPQFFEEDASGVAGITPGGGDGSWTVWTGGHEHSYLPFGEVHTALGALPTLLHPDPRSVAVIGLGSGDTAWAAGFSEAVRSVRVFEICHAQPRLLRRFADATGMSRMRRFLDDPRLELRLTDGRNALRAEPARYDVIELDALWPYYAYSGNLYSREFYRLVRSRLRPGGVLCTWAPTDRARATLAEAFPYLLEADEVVLASEAPLRGLSAVGEARRAEALRYLGELRTDQVLRRARRLAPIPAGPAPTELVNEDLFPRDEFAVPHRARTAP
jgi:hypothetical protein